MKDHKKLLILTSLVILIPAAAGLLLWNRLPETMVTHIGFDGADGWMSKPAAILVMPLTMLSLHWLCLWLEHRFSSIKAQSKKVQSLVYWLIPMVSLITSSTFYAVALQTTDLLDTLMPVLMGLLFAILGNYLPKIRQNRTLGIKLPWTFANEENWNRTHRLSGRLWLIGGLATMFCGFLPGNWGLTCLLVSLVPMIVIPTLYSWHLSKTLPDDGKTALPPMNKTVTRFTWIFVIAILIFLVFVMFTGNVDIVYNDDTFTVDSAWWTPLTVKYDTIDSMEFREVCDTGSRTSGFGSPRLLMGLFENEEFGSYNRYSYAGCDAAVVLEIKGRILVLGGKTEADTRAIYETLLSKQ